MRQTTLNLGLGAQTAWGGWRENFLARLAHSTSVIMLLDADYTNSTADLVAALKVCFHSCTNIKICQLYLGQPRSWGCMSSKPTTSQM